MCSLTAGLIGASALFGYQQQVQQANTQAKAMRTQAEADEQNARIEGRKQEQIAENYAKEARDLRNRQRLAQGAQRAQAGAAGLGFSGSQEDILSSGLDAYKQDQATLLTNQRNDNYNSRVVQTNYINDANQKRAAADNVVSQAKGQLVPTLLSTAASIVGAQKPTASGSVGNTSGNIGNATMKWRENTVSKMSNFNAGKNRGWTITNPNKKNYW